MRASYGTDDGNHLVGVCRTFYLRGGFLENVNGLYDLDPSKSLVLYVRRPDDRWRLRRTTQALASTIIFYDSSRCTWVLVASSSSPDSGEALISCQLERGQPTPEGAWKDGLFVEMAREWSPITNLAFPVPVADLDFYAKHGRGEHALLQHPGLVMLRTGNSRARPFKFPGDANAGINENVRAQVPAVLFQQPGAVFTILYSHGNADDLGIIIDDLEEFSKGLGVNLFAYDYIGYSTSRLEGQTPSEVGCYMAIMAAWDYLTIQRQIPPCTIILYGRSMGSGPAAELASQHACRNKIAGVILESPLLSGGCSLFGTGIGSVLRPFDLFVNYQKLPLIQVPVAVFHGTLDEVVPLEHGRKLQSLCKFPYKPLWLDGYGHNNLPSEMRREYVAGFLDFLAAKDVPAASRAFDQELRIGVYDENSFLPEYGPSARCVLS